jgi:hypothetical protein
MEILDLERHEYNDAVKNSFAYSFGPSKYDRYNVTWVNGGWFKIEAIENRDAIIKGTAHRLGGEFINPTPEQEKEFSEELDSFPHETVFVYGELK